MGIERIKIQFILLLGSACFGTNVFAQIEASLLEFTRVNAISLEQLSENLVSIGYTKLSHQEYPENIGTSLFSRETNSDTMEFRRFNSYDWIRMTSENPINHNVLSNYLKNICKHRFYENKSINDDITRESHRYTFRESKVNLCHQYSSEAHYWEIIIVINRFPR